MKTTILACTAALAFAAAGTTVEAATYSVDVTADPYRDAPANSGLQTRAVVLSSSGPQNFNGATYTFDLSNIGDSVSMDIYGLVAYDAPIDADDLIPQASTAAFDFGGLGSVVVDGTTAAFGSGMTGYALASFVSTLIRISATEAIRIALSDTIFGTDGSGNFVTGRAGVGFVNATFTLAAIPVPATLPLVLSGLGMLGFAARRRKSL